MRQEYEEYINEQIDEYEEKLHEQAHGFEAVKENLQKAHHAEIADWENKVKLEDTKF